MSLVSNYWLHLTWVISNCNKWLTCGMYGINTEVLAGYCHISFLLQTVCTTTSRSDTDWHIYIFVLYFLFTSKVISLSNTKLVWQSSARTVWKAQLWRLKVSFILDMYFNSILFHFSVMRIFIKMSTLPHYLK